MKEGKEIKIGSKNNKPRAWKAQWCRGETQKQARIQQGNKFLRRNKQKWTDRQCGAEESVWDGRKMEIKYSAGSAVEK